MILAVLLLAQAISASDITLAWDASPDWPEDVVVRIYERKGNDAMLVATSEGKVDRVTILSVSKKRHKYVARAYSESLDIESEDSNEARTKGNESHSMIGFW
jgi:hypothetical protein